MGNSKSKDYKDAAEKSRAIERINVTDNTEETHKVKLLLLGAGESGKSTVFKQMRIIYGTTDAFPEEDRVQMKYTICGSIISNIRALVLASDRIVPLSSPELGAELLKIPDETDDFLIDAPLAELLTKIWADEGAKQTWARRSEFQIQDALGWFMANLDRIKTKDYVPTVDDLLRVRVRTSGIVEQSLIIDGINFMLYDVGGQRNERKKWVHCFDNVTAVMFVAAVSEYDQRLFENEDVSRMDEAVMLFDEVCNMKHFVKTAMILFLNKSDIFKAKLRTVAVQSKYPDYAGPEGTPEMGEEEFEKVYVAALDYFVKLFKRRNQNTARQVYHHPTCATDTNNIKVVFNACKDIILKSTLRGAGFIN